jgi:rubredoxin
MGWSFLICGIRKEKIKMRKTKVENFLELCNSLQLQICDDEYANKVQHDEKVKLKDLNNYLYSLNIGNLRVIKRRNTVPNIFFNYNFYTKENIENYIKKNSINIVLKSTEVRTAIEKLEFTCPIHGTFIKSWNEIKNGQYCPLCGREKCANNKKNDYNDIKIAFENLGYTLISKEYISNQKPLD